jgi:hypothetical protein
MPSPFVDFVTIGDQHATSSRLEVKRNERPGHHGGRAAGFSLDEIARMFASDERPRIDRQLLTAKADELDTTIRKLTKMRDGLGHAAACPAPRHTDCPTFQRLLRAVQSGAIRPVKPGSAERASRP